MILFTSLYLTLRISYRTILSKVRDSVPSFSSMREAMMQDDEEKVIPVKKAKLDSEHKKKALELEKKLAELQKQKTPYEKTPMKKV